MHVQPRRLDVSEQFVLSDGLQMCHHRDDVPVPERVIPRRHRNRAWGLEMNDTGGNRKDGRSVRRRDVDPEVERMRRIFDAGVVEVRAHRMGALERRKRPWVGQESAASSRVASSSIFP